MKYLKHFEQIIDNLTEIKKLIKDYFNFPTNIEAYEISTDHIQVVNINLDEDDHHPMSMGSIFELEYDSEYNFVSDGEEKTFNDIESIKKFIIEYLNDYKSKYYSFSYINEYSLKSVDVLDPKLYSDYIVDRTSRTEITNEFLEELNNIYEYLTKDGKAKVDSYTKKFRTTQQAKNFKLI